MEKLDSRLNLSPLTLGDVAELHRIYADPATWRHLPAGRHQDVLATRRLVERSVSSRENSGLGQWAIRLKCDSGDGIARGQLIGAGGVTMLDAGVWNLGYRLDPAAWGRGFATAIANAGLGAGHDTRPDVPVTARALAVNPASSAVLDKIGMTVIWRGASQTTSDSAPTAGLERIIYADRPVDDTLLERLIELG